MKYCSNCGAELSIDYDNKKLVCEYCKAEYDYSNDTNEKEYVCLSCDVDFISDKPKLNYCPYCNNKNLTIIKLKKNMKIDGIIPFVKTQRQFIKEYKKILRKKVFIPNIFYKNKIIKSVNNIYLPYYLCDMHAKAKILINTNKKSEWISNNYKYKKIDDYALYRYCESDIKEIPILLSDKMDSTKIDVIMPFNYDNIREIKDNILENYIYEDSRNKLNKEKLRNIVEELFIKNSFNRIRDYNKVELKRIETAVTSFDYKRVLLPVWILNIEYKKRIYYFIMNGQTGKVYYDLPRSKVKIITIYIVLFIIIFLILVLMRGLL